jgi:predicted ArsR family transcriptional regulator
VKQRRIRHAGKPNAQVIRRELRHIGPGWTDLAELRNMGVVKYAETNLQHGDTHADGRTRHMVARLLLEQGPVSAASVAVELGLSPTAVRRHLDALLADGEACEKQAPTRGQRGRGRPPRHFSLTEAGRARFGHAYDDLAVSALRFLREHGGEDAVRAFAEQRVRSLIGQQRSAVTAESDSSQRAEVLANLLTREGYAASTRKVGTPGDPLSGSHMQLCQHHCPVAHVAAEFPQLCEAETAAFADLLGTHVQRLATIARGDAVCTTHVPASDRASTPDGGKPA